MAGQWRKIKKQNIGQNALKQSPPTHVPHFLDLFTRFFFNFRFSKKGLKQTKTIKNDHLLYNTVSLKKPYKFCSKHVSVWCQKKHLHCTISGRPRTALFKNFKSKCLYISVYISPRKCLFQRHTSIYKSAATLSCSTGILPSTEILRYFHLQY